MECEMTTKSHYYTTNYKNYCHTKTKEKIVRLTQIIIQNFCSCNQVEVNLSQFNPIIGYNNSGKSNIIKAINWLFKKSVLSHHSFGNVDNPIIVEGTIVGAQDVLHLLHEQHQPRIQEFFLTNGELRIRRIQSTPSCAAKEVKLEIFHPSGQWKANPAGIENALDALFPEPIYIQAMDDAADDVGKFGAKNTIGLLLKYTLDEIRRTNTQAITDITNALQSVDSHLNGNGRIAQLGSLEASATAAVQSFFPDINLHLQFAAPEFDDLVKSASLDISHTGGEKRPFSSFGHGAQRSIQMAMIQLLASQVNHPNGTDFGTVLLLIDEPELYLHPQAIEILCQSLNVLTQNNFQVIFSTHSPLMIGKEHVLDATIVYKDANSHTQVRQKLSTATQTIQNSDHQANVIFSLQNSTYLLFSDKVILAEGKTEKMLVPEIYKHIRSATMHRDKTCLIEAAGSTGIKPMMDVLKAVGFSPKAIVDLDYVFRVAPIVGQIQPNDPDFSACKVWFQANSLTHNFSLEQAVGLPCKGGRISAADAFELMAQNNHAAVNSLHAKMLEHEIWVWSKGAIEAHLGIQKHDYNRLQFIQTMHTNNNLAHAQSEQEIRNAINWI